MLKNYLLTAVRSMRRHLATSAINVVGLAIGFVAGFLILLWVQDELSFDDHYQDVDQIYRVMRTSTYGEGQVFTWPAITAKLDDVIDEEYPEIELAALISWVQDMSFLRGDVTHREAGIHAGQDFFRILKHPFIAGAPEIALLDPNAVVLTESMARKYFADVYEEEGIGAGGDSNEEESEAEARKEAATRILGRQLRLDNRTDVTVTAVVEDVKAQSVHQFDYVVAMDEYARRNEWIDDWGNNGLRMLVRLAPGADHEAVSGKIRLLLKEKNDDENNILFLQPYQDIHLRSNYENGVLVGGRIDYIRTFSIVGVFILLIAAINFMNLATARSALRAMEVGIRKTFGSQRRHLAAQFLGESVLTSLVAFLLALLVVFLVMPWFNNLTGKSIVFSLLDTGMIGVFAVIALATGLLAGLYPAFYLSAFSAIEVIRRGVRGTARGAALRRGLVVFQFFLSIVLIVGAVTVYKQVDFIRSKNLGLDRQDVFYARLEGGMAQQYESYRDRLLDSGVISSVTSSSNNPLSVGSSTSGGVRWDGKDHEDNTLYYILQTSYDFIPTMKMELAAGRDFSRDVATDSANVIINEAAARAMGFDDPVGQRVNLWDREGEIIGVVKDFHISSMYDPIEPLVMRLAPENTWLTLVRPVAGRTQEALEAFEAVFREFNPTYPFEYHFVDDSFERTYNAEIVMGKLAGWFTVLAIFVACLGLFGLASFTAERRTREIGIRKVLGATVGNVVLLLSREFVTLVLLAFVLAVPVSWFAMNRWLDDFAFRTELGAGVFVLAAVAVLVIAYATVGFQSVRAAIANPADSLRSE